MTTVIEKLLAASSTSTSTSTSTTRLPTWLPLQAELLRDDHLHDLVRTGVDALHARIHERPRDRVLEHVSVAAEELQTGVDHLLRHIGGPELRDRRLLDQLLAGDVLGD